MKVLVVDDEPPIVTALEYNLRREGFQTITASTGPAALDAFFKEGADVVILDLMLPGMSGTEVCQAIRRRSSVPILMLTARTEETDRVVGLELGADDYVMKPFSMPELMARVKAQARRSGVLSGATEKRRIVLRDLVLDLDQHRFWKQGQEMTLSRREFDLLATFMSRHGSALSRQELLRQAWGDDQYIDERTVDVHVRWLREKIEDQPSAPRYIQTVRGVGYRFQT